MQVPRLAVFSCAAFAAASAFAQQQRSVLGPVEVIGTAPVPGVDRRREEIALNVQSLRGEALRSGASLPELLGSRLQSVNVNEIQGNPFQADVNFRGFTASPLLGTPQGLSVFVDGVRANEPFGDVVNWDLIPRAAIDRIDLIPGPNPLFGLNTLGGALAMHTKSGFRTRGPTAEIYGGSFGRRSIEVEHGGADDGLAYFLAGTWFKEDGWRDASPSDVKQFFAKLSYRGDGLQLDASLAQANTDLTGNGLAPRSMLEARREAIFTKPDNTLNRATALTLNGSLRLTQSARLAGTVYARKNRTRTSSGDVNDAFEDGANDGAGGANGGLGLNDETAVHNRTRIEQRAYGASWQWIGASERNQWTLGASFDSSRAAFSQTAEEGVFDAGRGVNASGAAEIENNLDGKWRNVGVWVSDVLQPTPALALTLAGRFNRTRVTTTDVLNPVPPNLSGDHRFSKFNPALGVTYTVSPALAAYASAAQGSRAPSPIELGCADPANPCTLPNALQSDPTLKQVVTRSVEAGVRGRRGNLQWQAALYGAVNRDDILFVGTSTSAGYFTNFGKTRRRGAELGIAAEGGALDWRVVYGYTRATFGSSACLLSENNSTRGTTAECTARGQDDEILVLPGNRIPAIPAHTLKLGLEWKAAPAWTLSMQAAAYSSQYARGNENNQHRAGAFVDRFGETRTFEGAGKTPGYAVINLALRYRAAGGWSIFGRVGNLFDKRYSTAAALAENPFDLAGTFRTNSEDWTRTTFYAPGAPRAVWMGVAYRPGAPSD